MLDKLYSIARRDAKATPMYRVWLTRPIGMNNRLYMYVLTRAMTATEVYRSYMQERGLCLYTLAPVIGDWVGALDLLSSLYDGITVCVYTVRDRNRLKRYAKAVCKRLEYRADGDCEYFICCYCGSCECGSCIRRFGNEPLYNECWQDGWEDAAESLAQYSAAGELESDASGRAVVDTGVV